MKLRTGVPWRATILVLVAACLPLAWTAAAPPVAAGAQDYDVAGGHYYEQGGSAAGSGFVLQDDEAAPFWAEFRRLGGAAALGYPISRRYACDGGQCQGLQHAVFKRLPGAGAVELLSVFDLLHHAGRDPWLEERLGVPGWSPDDGASRKKPKDKDEAARADADRERAMIESNPALHAAYWRLGTLSPTVYGTARSFRRARDGREVLRTQRAVFVQEAGDGVRQESAGTLFVEAALAPAEALEPVPAPPPIDATAPTWISVPDLAIDAAVIPMHMGADNLLPVPDNGSVVAWYSYGARLGDGGNAVLAGHVDWDARPGAFWRLRNARPGQVITLYGKAGRAYDYRVEWAKSFAEDAADGLAALSPSSVGTTLTLITCTGRFDARTRAYEDRHVVRATLVEHRPWEAGR